VQNCDEASAKVSSFAVFGGKGTTKN